MQDVHTAATANTPAPENHRRMPTFAVGTLLAMFTVLELLDLLSTRAGLSLGLHEMNPLQAHLFGLGPWAPAALKGFALLAVAVLPLRYLRRAPRLALYGVAAMCVLQGAVVLSNAAQLAVR